jgi:hypothetical protein
LRYKRELNPNALFRLGVLAAASTLAPSAQRPALLGLDHIPVGVSDLERAGATFGGLGFALKPGRDHANGIRNAHEQRSWYVAGVSQETTRLTLPSLRDEQV